MGDLRSRLEVNEAYLAELERSQGWDNTGFLDRCDRCSAPDPHPIYLGDPPDILLNVCEWCERKVKLEMASPGSGFLGRAWAVVRSG